MKISIFDQNFDFCTKVRVLVKISTFHQNLDFWSKFRFMVKISILVKISIVDQNFDFCTKLRFLVKISIFCQNFDFWSKFLTENIGLFFGYVPTVLFHEVLPIKGSSLSIVSRNLFSASSGTSRRPISSHCANFSGSFITGFSIKNPCFSDTWNSEIF